MLKDKHGLWTLEAEPSVVAILQGVTEDHPLWLPVSTPDYHAFAINDGLEITNKGKVVWRGICVGKDPNVNANALVGNPLQGGSQQMPQAAFGKTFTDPSATDPSATHRVNQAICFLPAALRITPWTTNVINLGDYMLDAKSTDALTTDTRVVPKVGARKKLGDLVSWIAEEVKTEQGINRFMPLCAAVLQNATVWLLKTSIGSDNLVTTITFGKTDRNTSPTALEAKCKEVWQAFGSPQ